MTPHEILLLVVALLQTLAEQTAPTGQGSPPALLNLTQLPPEARALVAKLHAAVAPQTP